MRQRMRLLLDWLYDQLIYPLVAHGQHERSNDSDNDTMKGGT